MRIKKDKSMPTGATELRRKAEEQLQGKKPQVHTPQNEEETKRLLHELEVHQIEMEMQVEELRQAKYEVDTALQRYADLYEFAPVGYVTLDGKGTIRAANLAGSDLMRVARPRLIGRRFGLFVTEKDRPVFYDFLEKVFTSRSKEMCEVMLLKGENTELFVQIEGVADASGEECRIVLIDITERRLAGEAAEAIARAKSQFFTNMSHELRTPMTGILGMLQLTLEEEIAPLPREYLETTLNSARSLLRILNDILDMAKIEAGKLVIEDKPFSPQGCISDAADIFTPEVRRKGLDFVVSVADDVPETVAGDQTRLRQVLLNLIGNAIKFTDAGKVELRVTAGRMTSEGKREINFAITDTGIGIPEDKKGLLFQTFSQVDASHSRSYGGTGLGLAICREIVNLMGGTISFASKEGVGSTFSFTIPLGEVRLESNALIPVESLLPETMTAPEGERIPHLLLAEDDPTNRQILEIMLRRSNYNLDIVEDGEKAVEMWEKGDYDLVLMDVQMPRLSGFEATRAIREKERKRGGHTPIVAMTAHAHKEDEERCLAAGMDAYISKPIDFKKCLQVIRANLKKRASFLTT